MIHHTCRCTELIRTLQQMRPKDDNRFNNKEDVIRVALDRIKQQEAIESSFVVSPTRQSRLHSHTDTTLNISEDVIRTELRNLTPFYDHHRCIARLNEQASTCRARGKLYCRHVKVIIEFMGTMYCIELGYRRICVLKL